VLALAGGFSASLVHRILNRVIRAIESLFGADDNDPDAPEKAKNTVISEVSDLEIAGNANLAENQA
jgi:hypothetical protein